MVPRPVQTAGVITAVLLLLFGGLVYSSDQPRPYEHCHHVRPSVLTPAFPVEQSPYANCTTNFTQLERALLETGNNRYEIIRAFYPPIVEPSLYVDVEYKFGDGDNQTVENWIWAAAYFFFIQPPSLFVFTSLAFTYPTEQTQSLSLSLPAECSITNESVIETPFVCGQNPMLDVLTERLQLYGKYNNLRSVVVTETLSSAICVQDLKDKHKDERILTFFVCIVVLPFVIICLLFIVVKSLGTSVRLKLKKARNHPNVAALALTGGVFSFYSLVMDFIALVYGYTGKHELDKYNITVTFSTRFTLGITIIDFVPTVLITFGIILLICGNRCKKEETSDGSSCINCVFKACWFCVHHNYKKISNSEKELWLLTLIFSAPLVCMATHACYIVFAWICDQSHASSATFIVLLSFFYYFISFRQIYILLSMICTCHSQSGAQIQQAPRSSTSANPVRRGDEQTDAVYADGQKEYQELERIDAKFNICVFAIEIVCAVPLLVGMEFVLIFSIGRLPVNSSAASSYVFQMLQLGLLILAILITYKILVTDHSTDWSGLLMNTATRYSEIWKVNQLEHLSRPSTLANRLQRGGEHNLLNPQPQNNNPTEVLGVALAQMAYYYIKSNTQQRRRSF